MHLFNIPRATGFYSLRVKWKNLSFTLETAVERLPFMIAKHEGIKKNRLFFRTQIVLSVKPREVFLFNVFVLSSISIFVLITISCSVFPDKVLENKRFRHSLRLERVILQNWTTVDAHVPTEKLNEAKETTKLLTVSIEITRPLSCTYLYLEYTSYACASTVRNADEYNISTWWCG